ncbi:MAG TPA: hypothetical protein PKO33_07395, partial [Pyrinomonadaceae bacterium]|nr:hypothetical protein [Pyrinomonadaceae bacterium]
PAIIESSAPVFQAVAEPLGKIDKIVMIDQGNGNGESSGINRFAQTAPSVIFGLLQQLQAMGLSIPEVMEQLGINNEEKIVQKPDPAPKAEKDLKSGGA